MQKKVYWTNFVQFWILYSHIFFLAKIPYFNYQIYFQSSLLTKKETEDASKRLSSYCMGALNVVNGNHNSQNISEGQEVIKSRPILATRCAKKTGKTREILKTMCNTMECEKDSFSNLDGAKETHQERTFV